MHRPPDKVHGGHTDEGNVDSVLSEYSIDNSNNSNNNCHLLNVHLVSDTLWIFLLTLTYDNPVT